MFLFTAAFLGVTILKDSDETYLTGPVFTELKRFVGGTWEGVFPKGATITLHFYWAAGGKVIRGDGNLSKNGKTLMYFHPSMGWDPVKKAVSYLDMHNNDTIYLGTVKLDKGWIAYDFVDALNPKKRLSARQRFTGPDTYEMDLGSSVVEVKRRSSVNTGADFVPDRPVGL